MIFILKEPNAGDVRVKKGFLFLPVNIHGERRWLRHAERLQVYSAAGSQTGYDYSFGGWRDVEWNDKVESWSISEQYHPFSCTLTGHVKIVLKEVTINDC